MKGLRKILLTFLLSHTTVANSILEGEVEDDQVEVLGVEVPRVVSKGSEAELGCRWGGGGGRLYSLKWYKDDLEFFRYLPEDEPSVLTRPLPGVTVDRERSTGEVVVLVGVGVGAGGRYKCEVVGAPPTFHTADRSATLSVLHVPESGPVIYGARHEYSTGESAHLTCVSPRTMPPATLTWFINDRQAPAEYSLSQNSSRVTSEGLVERRLGLRFKIARHHFVGGQLRLRCAATIPGLYHKTRQYSVGDGPALSVPVMESRDSAALSNSEGSSSSSSSSSSSHNSSSGRPQDSAVVVLLLPALLVLVAMRDRGRERNKIQL